MPGTVEVEGRPVTGPDPAIGFVFQEPRLLPWRDALANVAYPLELAGAPRADREARAHELLRLVGLGRFRRRPAEPAVGWHASAGRARPCARPRAVGPPPRRAVQRPRRADPRAVRHRAPRACGRRPRRPSSWSRTASPRRSSSPTESVVLSPRPGRVATIVTSKLARPRRLEDLESPALGEAAATVRAALGRPGDPDPDPATILSAGRATP